MQFLLLLDIEQKNMAIRPSTVQSFTWDKSFSNTPKQFYIHAYQAWHIHSLAVLSEYALGVFCMDSIHTSSDKLL